MRAKIILWTALQLLILHLMRNDASLVKHWYTTISTQNCLSHSVPSLKRSPLTTTSAFSPVLANALAPKHTANIRHPKWFRHAQRWQQEYIIVVPKKTRKSVGEATTSIHAGTVLVLFFYFYFVLFYFFIVCQPSCEKWMGMFCQLSSHFFYSNWGCGYWYWLSCWQIQPRGSPTNLRVVS